MEPTKATKKPFKEKLPQTARLAPGVVVSV